MVPLRLLALLPVLEPPAALVGLAAAGHDVHLVATVPGGPPRRHTAGVAVWSTGMWWQAVQGAQPQVLLSQKGDRRADGFARRIGPHPHLRTPHPAGDDPVALEAALLGTIPAGGRRAAATLPVLPDPFEEHGARIVAWVHYGVPYRRAGSEVMLHTMLRALHDTGMGVLAVTSEMPEAPPSWTVDGIEYRQLPHASAELLIRRVQPHVVVTHHHLSPQAMHVAKEVGARSVLVVHNDHAGQAVFLDSEPDLVVYNTDWVRASLRPDWPHVDRLPGMIVHPPVDPGEHHVDKPGDHVTLVNLSANKGVHTWRAAAGMLPDVPFLGVVGAHGVQETGGMPPNVTVAPHTTDMRRDVWARTRLLLMPSVYESWGLVAQEAAASGIPVIAHPTPGLVESLGDAATFIDRDDHQAWADAIRGLYRGGRRRGAAQKAARERSALIADQTATELKAWTEAIQRLVRP